MPKTAWRAICGPGMGILAAARHYPRRAWIVAAYGGLGLAAAFQLVAALRGHSWMLAFVYVQVLILLVAVFDGLRNIWELLAILDGAHQANAELSGLVMAQNEDIDRLIETNGKLAGRLAQYAVRLRRHG